MTATATAAEDQTLRRRVGEALVTFGMLGETGVGLLVAAMPGATVGWLLGASIEGPALVVARMAGLAVAALGLAWWPYRTRLDAGRRHQVAASFIGYNVGVGLLFLTHAWAADRLLLVAWVVSVAHLGMGVAFAVVAFGGSVGDPSRELH